MSQVAEPSQRMSIAAVAAGAVAAVLFIQDLIGSVQFVLVGYMQSVETGMDPAWLWQSIANGMLILLAFAIGVWISLWRLAPIARELEPTTVVLRGLLAAGTGAVLVFLVHLGLGLVQPLSGTGSLVGNSFPALDWDGIAQATVMALQAGFSTFLQHGPVVVLVVLLVWIWLRRHPSRHAVSVDTAEV